VYSPESQTSITFSTFLWPGNATGSLSERTCVTRRMMKTPVCRSTTVTIHTIWRITLNGAAKQMSANTLRALKQRCAGARIRTQLQQKNRKGCSDGHNRDSDHPDDSPQLKRPFMNQGGEWKKSVIGRAPRPAEVAFIAMLLFLVHLEGEMCFVVGFLCLPCVMLFSFCKLIHIYAPTAVGFLSWLDNEAI
jgi:hypothetical protein